jgi:iron(III) transport system ATP-binding protein
MFLHVDRVSVSYPRATAPAVNAVSIGLEAGQLGVLVGPSGSGKTTLLRAIAGLEHPQSGCITLDQVILDGGKKRVPAEARRIGMVFQDFALFPHLSVAANIGFGLRGMHKQQKTARIQEMLHLVGLDGMETKFPHQLSGGQQQRVAVARALAPQPRLLLLDEPFSSLDVELRERLAEDVRKILKQAQITALMVTHDQMEAFAIADVIGVMQKSHLEQWASPETLYHRPATRFVADFIGQGQFLPAHLTQAGHTTLATVIGNIANASNITDLHPDHTQFEVMLRSDDIIFDAQSPFKATIIHKSFRGAHTLYHLELSNGARVMSLASSRTQFELGASIGIRLNCALPAAFPVSNKS